MTKDEMIGLLYVVECNGDDPRLSHITDHLQTLRRVVEALVERLPDDPLPEYDPSQDRRQQQKRTT